MDSPTRREFKRFFGEEWRTEDRKMMPLSRAERNALILLALKVLENLPESRLRRLGSTLIWFLARYNEALPTQAAIYLKRLPVEPEAMTPGMLEEAHKKIAGELRRLDPKAPRDALQRRLDFIGDEAGLSNLDRQLLGVLVRANVVEPYGALLAHFSPYVHVPEDVHLLSLMIATGRTRTELKARLSGAAPLIASGLVRDVKDNEFAATAFAISLARLRSKMVSQDVV